MTEAASTGDIRISCHVEVHGIKCWRIQEFQSSGRWKFIPNGTWGFNTRSEALQAAMQTFQGDQITVGNHKPTVYSASQVAELEAEGREDSRHGYQARSGN